MQYRVLNLEHFPRKEHFAYFQTFANPYVGITVDVDITRFLAAVKRAELPFSLSLIYCLGRAANRVPQLRQRILDGVPVEFDRCDTSHIVLHADESYGYCRLNCMQSLDEFLPEASALHKRAGVDSDIDDGDDALSLLFVSCLPWLRFRDLTLPTPVPADSNPRITCGKYETQNGRTVLPVNLLANHALVDGLHIHRFFAALDEELEAAAIFAENYCKNRQYTL